MLLLDVIRVVTFEDETVSGGVCAGRLEQEVWVPGRGDRRHQGTSLVQRRGLECRPFKEL